MKYITEFRDSQKITELSQAIHKIAKKKLVIMEVCGSHTMAIHRFGIKNLLPSVIELVSGPGCPVCVTSIGYIDKAIALAQMPGIIIATFGDLIKVPGSVSSLENEKARGADIRMVYSITEAIELAKLNSNKHVVFLAIGFETTTPPTAAGILSAHSLGINNFSALCAHKVMPPPMQAIIDEGIAIDAFLAPGHVSVITGTDIYSFIPQKYNKGVVVAGFEPLDILQSVYMLVEQQNQGRAGVEIQYSRVVKPNGNPKALEIVNKVFETVNDTWRGLGVIPNSAMKIRNEYSFFDAETRFEINCPPPNEPKGCICGLVLKGQKKPSQCGLFGKACKPSNPAGACMVSSEGACNVYYRYNNSPTD